MGLFDFLKGEASEDIVLEKDSSDTPRFKDRIIESTNVEKDLQKLASKYELEAKDLDFTIISYKTFYRFDKSEKYRLVKETNVEEILSTQNLQNPQFEIRQQYKLNIYKKRSSSSFPIKILLGTNSDYTKIFATVKKSSSVNYHERLTSDILTQINKKKLKQGIYIGLFDEVLKDEIKKLTSHIMVNKAIKEEFRLTVCQGIEKINEYKEYINFIYKEKKAEENKNKSLKDQTNLSTVKKDEIVFEVIKSQKGQDGRSCKGEFLPKIVEYNDEAIKFEDITVGDNIYEKDEGNKLLFYAKQDGYVHHDGNIIDVSDDIVVDQISMKTTGSIRAGDKDIKVNVKTQDESIDAIGAGVVLDTKEVKVKGNVANNAKITADLVEIDGQTHQSSTINSKKAKVNLHRGFLEANTVEINTLEGGKVIADEVRVQTLSGGEIKAKKVYITRLISNANIYASELIEIAQVDGNSNHLYIDPKAQRGFDEIVLKLQKEIGDVEHNIKKNTKQLKSLKKRILADKETIDEIKQRVLEIKAQGQKPPQTMINKIKENKTNKLEFNKIVAFIKDMKKTQEELTEKITNFNQSIFDAKVQVNSPWKEYNEVVFNIVEPKKSIKRVMNESEVANTLGLKVTKDNQYIIANVD